MINKDQARETQVNHEDTPFLLHTPLGENNIIVGNDDIKEEEGEEDYYSDAEFESETIFEKPPDGSPKREESTQRCSSTYLANFDKGGGEHDDVTLPVIELPSQVVALKSLLLSVGLIAPRDEHQLHHPTKIGETQRSAAHFV